MKIGIISGSVRNDSQSLKVAEYLTIRLNGIGIQNEILDLNKKRLPLYNDEDHGPWEPLRDEIRAWLEGCDGYVFVSPEWDGMFSVGIHNLLHYVQKQMAHKPVLPIGVSDGRGGRYPLQQMRNMGYKNKRFVVIPESVIVDHVKDKLTDGKISDERMSDRIDYGLKILVEYAKSLSSVRTSGVVDHDKFKNGL